MFCTCAATAALAQHLFQLPGVVAQQLLRQLREVDVEILEHLRQRVEQLWNSASSSCMAPMSDAALP